MIGVKWSKVTPPHPNLTVVATQPYIQPRFCLFFLILELKAMPMGRDRTLVQSFSQFIYGMAVLRAIHN